MKFVIFFIVAILSFGLVSTAQDKPYEDTHVLIQVAHVENPSDINIFIPKLERQLKSINLEADFNVTSEETYILVFIESAFSNPSKIHQVNFAITLIGDNDTLGQISPVLFTRFNPAFSSDVLIIASLEDVLEPLLTLIHLSASYFNSECDLDIDSFDKKLGGDFTQAYLNYIGGTCAIIEDDFDTAIEYLTASLSYEPSPDFYSPIAATTNLAWIYVQQGDSQIAIELMDSLVGLVEDQTNLLQLALQKRAQIYALTFDYTSAINDMDSAIDLIESDDWLAEAYKQRGDIIMLIYEWNRALDDYTTAIELNPEYAEAYYRRGILLYTMVERENAVADFETYLELDPDGQFADSASEFIGNIQTELDALGG